jgi:hypothetical protein
VLGPVSADSPPEDAFLQAFVTYWTMIFDDENVALEARLEKEIQVALAAAERKGSADASATLWAGNSHLVLAELRAGQRKAMGAAFEAKKAKKLLEAAVASGARKDDALFGLGTYNYMADTLPSFIKGLRALARAAPDDLRAQARASLRRRARGEAPPPRSGEGCDLEPVRGGAPGPLPGAKPVGDLLAHAGRRARGDAR